MNFPPPTRHQARLIWAGLTGLAVAVLLALLAGLIRGLGWLLDVLGPVLWPIAAAVVLAYLLDPVVDFLERRKLPRTRAIMLVFAMGFLIMLGILGSIVPQAVVETGALVAKIPDYATNIQHRVEKWVNNPPKPLREFVRSRFKSSEAGAASETNAPPSATQTNLPPSDNRAPTQSLTSLDKETLQSAAGWVTKALTALGTWLLNQLSRLASFFGILVGLGLVPVYAFYFLLQKESIRRKWTDYLPVSDSSFKDELVFVIEAINNYLIAFFRGQVLVAVCDGILYTTGFLIIGLPYAVLLGVVATFLTIIPFLGAIVTCVAALIIAIAQFGDWQHPLLVLAVFAVVQTLEGIVIAPRIMGDKVGLHPVTILIALMVGTTLLGGILGGILAVPLTAALRVLMFRYIWRRPQEEPAS